MAGFVNFGLSLGASRLADLRVFRLLEARLFCSLTRLLKKKGLDWCLRL